MHRPALPILPAPWRALRTRDGSWTLEHTHLAQACHDRGGAWREARERYARETRLRQRARAGDLGRIARLADVGTGPGWNLAAALAALEGTGVTLEVTSFESDPEVLRASLALSRALAGGRRGVGLRWLEPVQRALAEVLDGLGRACIVGRRAAPLVTDAGEWRGSLVLELGDARQRLAALPPGPIFDAVFLDPFSPSADPPLWELAFLEGLAARMAPGAWLSTYSASLQVRARLVAAGLRVGPGARLGSKAQGTLASPDAALPLFSARVARKLARRAEQLLRDQKRAPAAVLPSGLI